MEASLGIGLVNFWYLELSEKIQFLRLQSMIIELLYETIPELSNSQSKLYITVKTNLYFIQSRVIMLWIKVNY